MFNTIRKETKHSINGVNGRLLPLHIPPTAWAPSVFASQEWVSEGRKVSGYGAGGVMHVEMRFDDSCQNGHMSFSITASIYTDESRKQRDIAAGGCLHDEIEAVFPELAHFIKWHMCDTRGPMHYLANVIYLAGDRDHYGKRNGEPLRFDTKIYFADSPVPHAIGSGLVKFIKSRMIQISENHYASDPGNGEFRVTALAHENRQGETFKFKPKFTFVGFGEKWHDCPFDDEHTAQAWALALNSSGCKFNNIPIEFSEGKKRELDKARSAAVWPDATDEELSKEPDELKKALVDRLPKLMVDFRATIENAGFLYERTGSEMASPIAAAGMH